MKNSKKNLNTAGQSTTEVKRSQKHDANLQKNSTLYFQIGLILCLLATYGLFEMQFQDQKIVPDKLTTDDVANVYIVPEFREESQEKKPESKVKRSKILIDKHVEVEDDTPDLEDEIFTPDDPITDKDPIDPNKIIDIKEPVEIPIVDFRKVEIVPVYPGCEKKKTNEDKRKCMSDKITKLVNKKFNTDIASEHGIFGLQKIQTQFTVDKNGNITDIKIRTPHPVLENEAKRVIDKIPSMTPGYQQNKPVGVIYNLPIKFMVRN